MTARITILILAIAFLAIDQSASAQKAAPKASPAASAKTVPVRDLYSDTWVATDGLGRAVSTGQTTGPPRKDKTLGIFYFIANHVPNGKVYDITKLLAANPSDPQYGPPGVSEWWSQPWLGYYQSNDPAVIRTHMQMLADAGVDVIIFDNTNGPTYPDVYLTICKVMEQMRAVGDKTPQIAFFTGANAWNTLYDNFYSKNMYPDLWFRWKGKPLMMVHLNKGQTLPANIMQFFNIRESWAWTPSEWFGDGHDKWPWLDNYPQNYGWHESPKKPEEMAVVVAQHATTSIGRSSLAQREPPVNALRLTPDTDKGLCFAQQFDRALKVSPEFVFVTGWNEWTAGRYTQDQAGTFAGKPNPKGAPIFVDEYNEEFSRDIEPELGRLRDDYYYQFVSYARRYKGARSVPRIMARKITKMTDWATVTPEFRDAIGDPVRRNHLGWDKLHYVNKTGRNDIVAAKVEFDASNLYFYVRTRAKLSPRTGPNWMLLYLNTDANYKTGWLGYDYVVNRNVGKGTTSLQKNIGGKYQWQNSGDVHYRIRGSEMMIIIPRALLGINSIPATIDFKWADNIQQTGNPSDFTLNGDSAPDGRFNYRAKLGVKM